MSDTPRTDKWSALDVESLYVTSADFSRQLERELNAANKRIADLEESLDTLTLVVGLTPVRRSKESEVLQEAMDLARATLAKKESKP